MGADFAKFEFYDRKDAEKAYDEIRKSDIRYGVSRSGEFIEISYDCEEKDEAVEICRKYRGEAA